MTNTFGIKRLSEVTPSNETPFLIEGLIHRTATMIYGRPKAGKSFVALSAGMALGEGTPWLGREVEAKNTLLWALDPGQQDETWQRFNTAGGRKDSRLFITDVRPEDTDEWWTEFSDVLLSTGVEVLIVDNLSALLGRGSYNNDADVRPALGRLQALLNEGIAIVLVHHSGKFNEETGSQKSPMGSTAIEAWGRQFLQVTDDQELRILRVYGNNTPEKELGIALDFNGEGDHGAFVTLVGEEETVAMSAEHEELVAMAQARWDSRKDRQKKQGRSPQQKAGKTARRGEATQEPRQHGIPERIRQALADSPEGMNWSQLKNSVQGAAQAKSDAAKAMVASGELHLEKRGNQSIYRLAK
ncbi:MULTISPECIES: AAA family ATPase [unclassified Streptomyces]|uniref:AAA family ATPase n=1 Tax=unclassified Streptomyces TaxID=2593676 RepID=UPI001164DF0A|nr:MULTISPECIES: AAA family ATPase [unclassified Streptomyces]NMI58423.1 AAA family ATPase [Streptomyces sp. RLA2-12]QDN57765.1 AAA family ATPase [Streptomyces sp. S1D4-20]QDN67862.1 AAA family ATPase [Streptomyces sp. S1D4-14]QDO50276.1 AAA family ATPase [Streptomyces sp. RLB3-5]QDO60516.1 AAA family ATPase [Streptomyces sp. RLB1-8]